MTKNECINELKAIAWIKNTHGESSIVINRWSGAARIARKHGVDEREMRDIWNGFGMTSDWKEEPFIPGMTAKRRGR